MSEELDNTQVLALLEQVARHDERAFGRLYESVARRVYAFAMHRLHDEATAGEIVGETLYEVWRRPTAFRGDAKFSTWVLGIARHKMLDRLRSRGPDHEDIDDHRDLFDADALDDLQQVDARQREAGVAHCLARLGDTHRECLHLVYFDGLSLAEVASVQAVPENTVKTRLFHARAKIKQCLARLFARDAAGQHRGGHD
jgi:RNA polymerase sigma-70 factor (ECF subfamily)